MGSSRMRRGVDPRLVVSASDGRITEAYNLAAAGRHLVRSVVMLDEILDSGRTIDVLVVEADIDAIRRARRASWFWLPMAAGRASWIDIVSKTPRLLADGAIPDPRLVLHGLHQKLEQAILLVTTGAAFDALTHPTSRPTPICWSPAFDVEGAPEQIMRRDAMGAQMARRFGHPETDFDRAFSQTRSDYARAELEMLATLRARARTGGVRLIVTRPQSYAEPPLHPRTIAALKQLIPEFEYPPEALVRRLSRMQVEGSHLSAEGRRLYSAWLTETILAAEP